MPVTNLTKTQVEGYIDDKFELEQDLAVKLWTVLDQPKYMDTLQSWALAALYQMLFADENELNRIIREEEQYLALYRYGRSFWALHEAVRSKSATPGDITDVIRLWGKWIKGAKFSPQKIPREFDSLSEQSKESRPGVPGKSGTEPDAKKVWTVLRKRIDKKDASPEILQNLDRYMKNEEARCCGTPYEVSFAQFTPLDFTLVQGGVPVIKQLDLDSREVKVYAGRYLKQPTAGSRTGILERAFGLLDLKAKNEGCDISGTTAVHTLFLDHFARRFNTQVPQTLYMLPLATLVAGYHHSVVEVALTLTFQEKIKYEIGDYTTLAPVGADKGAVDVCKRANSDKDNRRILVYYDSPWNPAGGYLYENSANFLLLADVKYAYVKCKTLSHWPKKGDVSLLDPSLKLAA